MRGTFVSAFLLVTSLALPAVAQTPEPSGPPRCTLAGEHLAGMVSVDLRTGSRAEIPLVDVVGSITMADRLEDVVVRVTSPLAFEGTFVPGTRGGPAAHAPRAVRVEGRSISVAPNVPFELRPAPSPDRVGVRIPTIFAEGAIEFELPCDGLRAGAPRAGLAPMAGMTPELETTRGAFLEFATDVELRSGAGEGAETVARLRPNTEGTRMKVRGRILSSAGAQARVQISVGPATIEGFVPRASVAEFGRDLVRPGGMRTSYAAQVSLTGPETETIEATLPAGTPVYGTTNATTPWATVTEPLTITLRRRVGATTRYALVFGDASVLVQSCRVDGVGGYPSCGTTDVMPRLALFPCTGASCRSVGFVEGP